jgi:hypothetical protein
MNSDEIVEKWVDTGLLDEFSDDEIKKTVAHRLENMATLLLGPNRPMSGNVRLDNIIDTMAFVLVLRIYLKGGRIVTSEMVFVEELIRFLNRHKGDILELYGTSHIDVESEIGSMFEQYYLDEHKTDLLDKNISKHKFK